MRSDIPVSATHSIICRECYNDFFCDVAHMKLRAASTESETKVSAISHQQNPVVGGQLSVVSENKLPASS